MTKRRKGLEVVAFLLEQLVLAESETQAMFMVELPIIMLLIVDTSFERPLMPVPAMVLPAMPASLIITWSTYVLHICRAVGRAANETTNSNKSTYKQTCAKKSHARDEVRCHCFPINNRTVDTMRKIAQRMENNILACETPSGTKSGSLRVTS